ncbi:MAG TPA: ABC transporter permease [Burkholderiales bacterium]
MPFIPIILWTDALIYLLLALIALFAWYVRGRPHLVAPWRRVAQSKSGMVAATMLAAYLVIGLLDSVHFRLPLEGNAAERAYSVEALSVFDVLAKPLRSRVEKTYSAPFAAYLFAKETIELPDGREIRDYPRLKYGAANLQDPGKERAEDIAWRLLCSLFLAALAWAAITGVLVWLLARRGTGVFRETVIALWRGENEIPWNAILATLGILMLIAFPLSILSANYHVFGTDKVGQDVLYLSLKSIRTGLIIGTLTTLVMLPFALAMGIMAGYFRGWADDVIQYFYTTLSSIPDVLLIAAAVLVMQVFMDTHPQLFPTITERADFRLLFLCIILGVTSWTSLCRLLRGEALKLRELEYIQAAHAFGVSHMRIMTRHILPNVMHIVLITVVLSFSGLVLAEAVLTYVGVGVDPSMISFGTMINSARLEMAREPVVWWSLLAAFLFMFMLVLAANLFADAVRDAFDPRVRTATKIVTDNDTKHAKA